jgi:hypothetical protein
MKKPVLLIALAVIIVSACGTSQKSTQESGNTRWPDFLRDWAADYEIEDTQRLAIIDQIDTLYRLVEDSTSDNELLCSKLCQLQNTISDAIVHDSSLVFPLMMRATARNFYSENANNQKLPGLDCDCEMEDYLFIDSKWHTASRENYDLMYTTMIGQSWLAPWNFANLVLAKDDEKELATAMLIVYNYTDTIIDNLQLTISDDEGTILGLITDRNTNVEQLDICVKKISLSPNLIMEGLAANGNFVISYESHHRLLKMVGFPSIFFMEQIEECPRLKEVLNQALK